MHISLNGYDWRFKAFVGEDWVWRNAEKPGTRDLRWWYQGSVPGSVQHDLLRAGLIPDPYVEQNSLLVEWASQRTWIYKKNFTADPAWQGQTVKLHFEGVDYAAQFFLNGVKLGQHASMYTPVVFDVTDRLKFGEENLLSVVLDAAPDEAPQVSKTEYVRTHKSRMTYWWDFCPRMIHLGIWDAVYLEITGPVQVTDLFVRPALTPDHGRADLSVSVALQSTYRGPARVHTVIRHEGREVARAVTEHALAPGETRLNLCLPVEQPRLWWPNGHGEQPLYEAEVQVYTGDTNSHGRKVTFGIRRLEMVQNQTQDPTALPYTVVINGKPIYMKGWNWVPMDTMYGVERPAKLERLLQLAKRANVNILRIWGGGLIEKEAFYDLCDRYGIMVWQEFIQSSSGIANKPSEDPAFIAFMVREAEQIIPRKRNHPSLVLWCGGNELMGHDGRPLTSSEPVLAALKDAAARLDPDRFWLPTSPSGPTSGQNLRTLEEMPGAQHDVHGPWEHQGLTAQYTLYNKASSLLHSEFGVEGMAHANVIEATIGEGNRWPASKENAIYFHRGSWWNNHDLVQECFGGGLADVPTLARASQFLQNEALRYALEANRRRQWQNSGSLPWQFNEPFPNAWCTNAVDYYTQPKAVYYGVSLAYAPVAVTARFATQAWAGFERFEAQLHMASSLSEPIEGAVLTARVVGSCGNVYKAKTMPVTVGAHGAWAVGDIAVALTEAEDELFCLDLRLADAAAHLLGENRYLFARGKHLAPMLTAPATSLHAVCGPDGLTVTNTGSCIALDVTLADARGLAADGSVYFGSNHFVLLPGESRTLTLEWHGVDPAEQRLTIRGWNTEVERIG